MATLFLDDLSEGQRFTTPGLTLTEAEIIDFAWRYDPQPFHLDTRAAAASPYGGLIERLPEPGPVFPAVHPVRHPGGIEHGLARH